MYGIPENRTNTITLETAEFDNPIYGSQESLNDAEMINSIYGDADFEAALFDTIEWFCPELIPEE